MQLNETRLPFNSRELLRLRTALEADIDRRRELAEETKLEMLLEPIRLNEELIGRIDHALITFAHA